MERQSIRLLNFAVERWWAVGATAEAAWSLERLIGFDPVRLTRWKNRKRLLTGALGTLSSHPEIARAGWPADEAARPGKKSSSLLPLRIRRVTRRSSSPGTLSRGPSTLPLSRHGRQVAVMISCNDSQGRYTGSATTAGRKTVRSARWAVQRRTLAIASPTGRLRFGVKFIQEEEGCAIGRPHWRYVRR